MSQLQRALRILIVLVISGSSFGCAAAKVAGRPPSKDLGLLIPGTPRNRVIAELGNPSATSEVNGEKIDSFSFDPGVSGGAKFGRAFFHVGADLFTLFLWELVGWPTEIAASNSKKKLDVNYDAEDKVKSVTDWTTRPKAG